MILSAKKGILVFLEYLMQLIEMTVSLLRLCHKFLDYTVY